MQLLPHFEPSGLDDQQHCMTSKPRKPVFSSFSLTALHFNRTITSHALVQLNLSFQPPHVSMQKGLVGDVRTNSFFSRIRKYGGSITRTQNARKMTMFAHVGVYKAAG